MIKEKRAKSYCKEDISNIENYDKAVSDPTQTWDCHHRDEIRTLPSGITVYRSREELKENGRYYACPANELIFLTKAEHTRLHKSCIVVSDETRQKTSASLKGENSPWYGKHIYAETRKKISDSLNGENHPNYGKHLTEETRKKISEARKAYWAARKLD